jgi:PAS domain S-box-containing protein
MNSIASENEQNLALQLELDRTRCELKHYRQQAAEMRNLILNLDDALFAAAPDGTVIELGPSLADFLGSSSDEPSDLVWRAAVHPDDVQRYLQEWAAINESRAAGQITARFRNRQGNYRPCLMRMTPAFDGENNILSWFGTTTELPGTNRRGPASALLDALCRLLAENEQLRGEFRDLFEEAPIPYVNEALDSRFIRANRAALKLLGVEPEEVQNIYGKSLVADTVETQQQLREAFDSISQGHERRAVELELRRKSDGKPIWVQWWSTPATDGQYTRTMMVDITDRVLIEQTRRALEFTLESGQVGDWDLDLVHDTSRRSLRHDQCFGYNKPIPEAEWGFEVFTNHLHPEDRELVRMSFSRAVAGGANWSCDFRVIWPDGSEHWLAARGKVFHRDAGLATRMLGIVMDITDRKRAEEVLKKAEETVRATKVSLEFALEAGHIGDWDLDLIHDTSRRSLRHDRCFGYEAPIPDTEWGVTTFLRHVHPEDRARVRDSMQVAVDGLMAWEQEFRVVWPDRSVHWLTARGSIYRTLDGRATRMLGVVMDITDRKATEQALQASEELSRGQVEALKSTLDALAVETTPDRLIGHILRTIAERFAAHSISVWCRDDFTATIRLEFAFEEGRLVIKTDPRFEGMDLTLPMKDNWPWPEVFRTGQPSIIEDIRTVPTFSLRDRLLPLGIVTVLLVPMSVCGRLEGAIGLRFTEKRAFGAEELELAQALANQAMLMIQFSRLSAQSREAAVAAERNRIARDVHDTLAQGLTGVIVQLEAAGDATSKGLTSEAGDHLSRAAELARNSLNEARRSVMALRPQALQDRDLSAAMSEMIDKMTARTSLRAQFGVEGDDVALPHEWEDNLLRIGQEAVTNIVRHAQASEFAMKLIFTDVDVTLVVKDNGRGFIPTARYEGFGLVGMQERVETMGGELSIHSAIDEGSTLTIILPLAGVDGATVR